MITEPRTVYVVIASGTWEELRRITHKGAMPRLLGDGYMPFYDSLEELERLHPGRSWMRVTLRPFWEEREE